MRPDWTRIIWTSAKARVAWEPRIQAINKVWLEVELDSVRLGLRQSALVFGEELVRRSGLPAIPVAPDRFAVGPKANELTNAYAANDDEFVGHLLGFPSCCRTFFKQAWRGEQVDTTWEMTVNSGANPFRKNPRTLEVEGFDECNILGRWVGVRMVTHLPCSFHCLPSLEIARKFEPLWPAQELAWTKEILSWPVEWSAVHGIGEVRFPVLKLSTRTTVYPDKRTVRREGTAYPAEAARGLTFPYRHLASSVPVPLPVLASPWNDNGFASEAAQDEGHAMVLAALHANPPCGEVLDVGAGNGLLVKKIEDAFRVKAWGVERDPSRAFDKYHIFNSDVRELMLSPFTSRFDTIVVSKRRFEEISGLEDWCRKHARQVCVYSYDAPTFARVA